MNKKIVIAVIALVAVIGIMLGVYAATRPEATEGAKTITRTAPVKISLITPMRSSLRRCCWRMA